MKASSGLERHGGIQEKVVGQVTCALPVLESDPYFASTRLVSYLLVSEAVSCPFSLTWGSDECSIASTCPYGVGMGYSMGYQPARQQ